MNYEKLLISSMKRGRLIYAFVLLSCLLSLFMLPQLNIDTDPENMLSEDAPARVFHRQAKSTFAMKDMIVVGAVSTESMFTMDKVNNINRLANFIQEIDGVVTQDVMALNTVDNISQLLDEDGRNQGVKFDYLSPTTLHSEEQATDIKIAVSKLPMAKNTLVSEDEKAISVYVPIKSKDLSYQIAEQIRKYIDEQGLNSDVVTYHITGLPVAEDQFGVEMFVQMGISAPLAGLAIFILLWYFFRNIPLIIAPMIVAMSTVIIIMGSLIGLGFTVHIMSSMIAIFLMPIAVVDSVHILSEFADNHRKGQDVKSSIIQVMRHLYKPMLFTSVTSSVGFYSLMLTPIPPVKVFGAFVGTGILLAFVLTIFFIPVYISRLSESNIEKLHNAVEQLEKAGKLSGWLLSLGTFATAKPKMIMLTFTMLLVVSIAGIFRIEVNDNPVNWFKANHEIRLADKALNEHFAGTYDAWLILSSNQSLNTEERTNFQIALEKALVLGLEAPDISNKLAKHIENPARESLFDQDLLVMLDDLSFSADEKYQGVIDDLVIIAEQTIANQQVFMRPDMLNWISQLQFDMTKSGLVGKVNTVSDVVRTVNRELNSGYAQDYVVPETSAGVAQTLLQFQSSHRPQDLWHFVTPDYQQALLAVQMTSGDNQHTSKLVQWVEKYMIEHPAPAEVEINWAGKSYLNVVWQDAMVNGMADSLISSFVIVFIMMTLLFRSVTYGVLAMLPLTFTISMIYGLIGWIGKAYDMPIAVLSALTLGLSIDFAIHFLQRVRELIAEKGDVLSAIKAMFNEPSRAIARNAIVIAIGFTPLLFSPLVPYITVGLFLASIMLLSALVTLILLPAALLLIERFTPTQTNSTELK